MIICTTNGGGSMRARIANDGHEHRVTLSYDFPDTQRRTRTFIGGPGSYVHELIGDSGYSKQVCERLYHSGTTLICDADGLLATIRREWRKGMRSRRDARNVIRRAYGN